MWRQAHRDTSMSDWCERKQVLHEEGDDISLAPSDQQREHDSGFFDFNFKSLNKVLQRTLFEFHDKHRKNINSLWQARDQLEAMMLQYQVWKESKKYPKFLTKMEIPRSVIGQCCPPSLDPQGHAFGEFLFFLLSSRAQQ